MRLYLVTMILALSLGAYAQPYANYNCSTAMQIVSGQTYSYPAWTGTNFAQTGPAYSCLTSQYDPAWFFFMMGNDGDIHITISTVSDNQPPACRDVDFILWGPYTSLENGCNGGLTLSKVVDCSYGSQCIEYPDLTNGTTGQFYIMMVSNYSKFGCTVTLSQTSGTGIMSLFPAPTIANNGPVCAGQSITLSSNTISYANYYWTGPNGFSSSFQNPVINNISSAQSGLYSCHLGAGSSAGPSSYTQLVVNPKPPVQVHANTSICVGNSIHIGSPTLSGINYSWSSTPSGFTSTTSNPLVSPSILTTYHLLVTDVASTCTDTASVTIAVEIKPALQGNVKYANVLGVGIDSCKISLLQSPNILKDSTSTNASGHYGFNCIDPAYYKLDPECAKKWGGGNSVDAQLILRYSVGLISFSAVQKKVADVNLSNYINASDAIMVMRRFIGQINTFPAGDWYFQVPDSIHLVNMNNTQNIIGQCYGDVNGSFNPTYPILAPQQTGTKSN